MRLAVIGSRNCPDLDISGYVDCRTDTIVSGGARGADMLARNYARQNGLTLVEYLPEYGKYGRRAPIMRNILIVDNSDVVLALWDGHSRGTWFTLNYARKQGKKVRIVNFKSRDDYRQTEIEF